MTDSMHILCPRCDAVNRIPSGRVDAGPKCGECTSPLFLSKPLALDGARFQQHLSRSDIPLLVDFWAPWCGPCHMMAPAFAEAARRLEPAVRLLKIDTEQAQSVAMDHGIRSIPTMILFQGGHELARVSGAMNPSRIVSWTRQYL